MSNKKSQINSLDGVLASIIIVLIMSGLLYYYHSYGFKIEQKIEFNKITSITHSRLNTLINNPGQPINWEQNPGNVVLIGLNYDNGKLSPEKLESFQNMDYDFVKTKLNIRNYDFYFNLHDSENNVRYEIGQPFTGTYIVNIQRRVIVDNEILIAELILTKNE